MRQLGLTLRGAILSLGWLSACSNLKAPPLNTIVNPEVKFIVIGDTPYTAIDEFMLARAVSIVRSQDYSFVIHLGDYKSSNLKCTDEHDDKLAHLISSLSPLPVFFTPGDNDWSDCDAHLNPITGQRYSEIERLKIIRDRFFSTPVKNGKALRTQQQTSLPENQSWIHEDIRYFTLHVTGTNNNREQIRGVSLEDALVENNNRDRANQEWIKTAFAMAKSEDAKAVVIAMHADMTRVRKAPADLMCTDGSKAKRNKCDAFIDLRALIRQEVSTFKKPVLLIHGDTGAFTLDQSFPGENIDNFWRLNAAGDGKYPHGMRDVTEVKINLSSNSPFKAKGLTSGIQTNQTGRK